MIRIDALAQVTTRNKHLYRDEELDAAATEAKRFHQLLPSVPKNIPFLEVQTFLRGNGFVILPLLDDEEGKWTGYRNIAEIHSIRVPESVPGLYIVAFITTFITEIPASIGNGDRLYIRSELC